MFSSENRKIFPVIMMLAGILLGFSLPLWIDFVFQAGHSIGAANVAEDYYRAVVWAIVLGVVLLLLPFPKEIHRWILGLWVLRCFVTLGFMLFYEDHYDLDAYHYFRESLARVGPDFFGFGRGTGFINWLTWTVNHTFPFVDSYHTLKVFWSFAGFVGSYLFYRIYRLYSEKEDPWLLVTLAVFPSSLFWSSILGKDPLTFLGTAMAAFGGLGLIKTKKPILQFLASLVLGTALIAFVRFWLVALVVFGFVAALVLQGGFSRRKKIVFSVLATSVFLFFLQITLSQWNISGTSELVDRTNRLSRAWGRGGSGEAAPVFGSLADIAFFIPQGALTSLFRPLPGEINNFFGFLAGLENLVLILGALWTFQALRRLEKRDSLIHFILAFTVIWSVVYGFISYQNLGTASRFKLQVLPFMLILPFYVREKLLKEKRERQKS